jgi:SHS2 domain-containing protein
MYHKEGDVSGYRIIDHTADTGIEAHAETLGEVFAQTALGMFDFLAGLTSIEEREWREVHAEATDREALLVAWLNELVFLFSTDGLLLRRFEILEMSDTHIRARCHGERLDRLRHHVVAEVKSATYHMLQVKKNRVWRARVILDI